MAHIQYETGTKKKKKRNQCKNKMATTTKNSRSTGPMHRGKLDESQ